MLGANRKTFADFVVLTGFDVVDGARSQQRGAIG